MLLKHIYTTCSISINTQLHIMATTILLATTSAVASADVLAASAALAGVSVDRADVLTQAGALTSASNVLPGSYDGVIVQSDAAISDAASWLGALGRCLKPTGTLTVAAAHQVCVLVCTWLPATCLHK